MSPFPCALKITYDGSKSEVYSLDWVSTMIASGSGDGRIRLWHSVTGALQASLGDVAGPQDGVTSVVLKHVSRGGNFTRGFGVPLPWTGVYFTLNTLPEGRPVMKFPSY